METGRNRANGGDVIAECIVGGCERVINERFISERFISERFISERVVNFVTRFASIIDIYFASVSCRAYTGVAGDISETTPFVTVNITAEAGVFIERFGEGIKLRPGVVGGAFSATRIATYISGVSSVKNHIAIQISKYKHYRISLLYIRLFHSRKGNLWRAVQTHLPQLKTS
jgi:hypothetical protein